MAFIQTQIGEEKVVKLVTFRNFVFSSAFQVKHELFLHFSSGKVSTVEKNDSGSQLKKRKKDLFALTGFQE